MKAVIFDMDGTLIDSEPLWKIAEKEVFGAVGVKVTDTLSAKTAAMTTRQVTEFWYNAFPWQSKSIESVENEVVTRVTELISERGQPMDGVHEVLHFFQQRGFKIGLATNAPSTHIPIVLEKLNISHFFHCYSSSESETEGKPHPDVYLTTLKKLDVTPQHCIAFEDSLSGITSAQAAGIKTVVVPDPIEYDSAKFSRANLKLKSLIEFNELHLDCLFNGSPIAAN